MSVTRFEPVELQTADVLVIGGGVAGLTAALHARGRDVLLVGSTELAEGGSSIHAQGGVAAALGPDDSPADHAADTVAVGAGLCDRNVVRHVTSEGPRRIGELLTIGANFDTEDHGTLALAREAAHSRRRVAHAAGDATGRELVRALSAAVASARHVTTAGGLLVLDLIRDHGSVVGAAAVDREGRHILLAAPEVVLATGGVAALWHPTTNPPESIGGGLAMAIRAGAAVADLEFVQFHPTALAVRGQRAPLLTEALRGEGAYLTDCRGIRFMEREHPDAELAPRDVVARAIWRRLRRGDEVLLDATHLAARLGERFPTVVGLCREHGYDLTREPVPVTPAAHYHMGGVVVDSVGHTSVPGLWACGEVARSGLHGANRLASNSLLEALVYGATVGEALAAACRAPMHVLRVRDAAQRSTIPLAEEPWLEDVDSEENGPAAGLRRLMWEGVGLERDAAGLRRTAEGLAALRETVPAGRGELDTMLTVAMQITEAATLRTESRGAHFRSDFPETASCWRQPLIFDGPRMRPPHPTTTPSAVTA